MSKINWGSLVDRQYETGVDRGVLYLFGETGVPWDGLISVDETTVGGDVEIVYFDGVAQSVIVSNEDFSASISSFGTPEKMDLCLGFRSLAPGLIVPNQPRTYFNFTYRTLIGNAAVGTEYGYKIHLVYNAKTGSSGKSYKTLGSSTTSLDQTDLNIYCVPPDASTYKPTSHFILNSRTVDPYLLSSVEDILYGTLSTDPRMPSQEELLLLFGSQVSETVIEPI